MSRKMPGVNHEMKNGEAMMLRSNPRFFVEKCNVFIYDIAKSISRSGASQSKKLHRYVLEMYGIDPTEDILQEFAKIRARPPHLTLKEKSNIKKEYNFSRDSLMAIFKTSKDLKKIDSALPKYAPGNVIEIHSVINGLNKSVIELCVEKGYANGVILSANALKESIGLDIWREEFLRFRIRNISKSAHNLYVKNKDLLKAKADKDSLDEWDEWADEQGPYGMGCYY